MRRNWGLHVAMLTLLLAAGRSATASSTLNIVVDPGSDGPVSDSLLSINLQGLAGTQELQGETLIDIRFDHGKYIDLQDLSAGAVFGYFLNVDYNPSTASITQTTGSEGSYRDVYYLVDRIGQPICSWDSLGTTSQAGKVTVSLFRIGFDADLERALITGVHLGFDASDLLQVTNATLNFYLSEPGTMRIGSVPEPATISQAIVAAALLSLSSRRRCRTTAEQ